MAQITFKRIKSNEQALEFLQILGNRKIESELKGSIFLDIEKEKEFIFAKIGEIVVGVTAWRKEKGGIHFCSSYVFPEYRNQGIFNSLFNLRMKVTKGNKITGVATKMSYNTYLRYGFTCVKEIKNYYKMEKVNA